MLFSASFAELGGGNYRLIVSLAAARGEGYFPRRATETARYSLARIVKRLRRRLTRRMEA